MNNDPKLNLMYSILMQYTSPELFITTAYKVSCDCSSLCSLAKWLQWFHVMVLGYSLQPPVSYSPQCPRHERTGAVAGKWWCPGCKWGHTGSRSPASSRCCRESGRGRPSGLEWTTRSSSTPERPAASTAHTLGLGKDEREWKNWDFSKNSKLGRWIEVQKARGGWNHAV